MTFAMCFPVMISEGSAMITWAARSKSGVCITHRQHWGARAQSQYLEVYHQCLHEPLSMQRRSSCQWRSVDEMFYKVTPFTIPSPPCSVTSALMATFAETAAGFTSSFPALAGILASSALATASGPFTSDRLSSDDLTSGTCASRPNMAD